ncbi:MAG: BrnT family toxin [Deltaproteobacteria bacterium]|nr:BrnT family toxin [Deltaproteobacteria bacterium]
MELYEIKQRILNLKDIEFNRFQNWFDKIGCNRINKNTKSSKIRQSVLNLSDKLLIVSHTEKSKSMRIISARPVTKQERQIYEEG